MKKTNYLTPSHKIYQRIINDPSIQSNLFRIGYTDRFNGIQEINLIDFITLKNEIIYNTGVPFHRIQYFKYKTTIVWDRQTKLNLIDKNQFMLI